MLDTQDANIRFDLGETIDERFDGPILWLLGGMLFFMPAAMGAYSPWSEGIAIAGTCALAILLAVKLLLRPDLRFVWSWAYLPVVLFLLLAGLQFVPLPADLVRALSPQTLSTKTALLSELPGAAQRLKYVSLNFYHEGARREISLLFAVTAVFVVTINVFRSVSQIRQLLWIIAIVGAIEGLLALAQAMTGATAVYWTITLPGGMRPDAGSFPNHNFFSQFMNLSSGAMLGLLLVTLDRTFRRHDYTAAEIAEKLTSAEFRPAWLLATMLAVSAASVFLSLSRGGMLSLAGAGVIVGVFLTLRGGARGMGIMGWLAGLLFVVVFGLVVAGGANLVEGRILRMGNATERNLRLHYTAATMELWKQFPLFGTGLGSYRFVFPKYDPTLFEGTVFHSENEYPQLLAETGALGGVIALGFVGVIAGCFLRAQVRGRRGEQGKTRSTNVLIARARRRRAESGAEEPPGEESGAGHSSGVLVDEVSESLGAPRPHRSGSRRQHGSSRRRSSSHGPSPVSSLSLGLAFGLIAVLLQSATDFAQHFLSTACLTAVACGLMVNLAMLRRRERGITGAEPFRSRGSFTLRIGTVLVVALISALVLEQAWSFWLGSVKWDRALDIGLQIRSATGPPDPGDVIDLFRAEDAAVSQRPGNATYRYQRDMDRFDVIGNVRDPVTGETVFTPEKRRKLDEIYADLNDVRWLAPTYGPTYAQLGQWEINFLGRPADGARHIHTAFELAPNDSNVCFIAATLAGEQGDWPESERLFERAALIHPATLQEAVDLYIGYFARPDLALKLAGDDVDQLRALSRELRERGKNPPTTGPATRPDDEAIAAAADLRVNNVIRDAANRPNASSAILAEMGLLCVKLGRPEQAIPYLAHALDLDYGNVDWRVAYAGALEAAGRKNDAIHQAEIILSRRPKQQAAVDIIDRLSVPAAPTLMEPEGTGEK